MEILGICAAVLVFWHIYKSYKNDKLKDEIKTIKVMHQFEIKELNQKHQEEIGVLKHENLQLRDFYKQFDSNLTAIPYMSRLVADIETYG